MLKWIDAPSIPRLLMTSCSVLLHTANHASSVEMPHFENNLAISAPSAGIVIRNHSTCQLQLLHIAHDNNQTKLSLPEVITGVPTESQHSEGSGHIAFSGGYFSSMQQRATGTYQVTCENKRHLLNLSFFIAPDHYSDGYFIDKTFSDQAPPVILYPPGKTSIVDNTPIVLTLINKEVTNDSRTEPSSNTNPENGKDVVADDAHSDD